jgi:hypothetical protein
MQHMNHLEKSDIHKLTMNESEANMTATDRRIIMNNLDNSMTILDFDKIDKFNDKIGITNHS